MSKQFVPMEKQSKKNQREHARQKRVTNGFNTGTRTMQTAKKPTRAKRKAMDKKIQETS